jgi:hypothetical protein
MSTSIDQQFIEYVVKSLVGNPDAVRVERRIDEKGVLLELTVDPEDLGRVIGKRGATAQSLRTLLRALGTKNDARYNLKIVDNGPPRPERTYSDEAPADTNRASAAADSDKPDDHQRQDDVAKEPTEEPAKETPTEKDHDSVLRQTRKELEELDDLDV